MDYTLTGTGRMARYIIRQGTQAGWRCRGICARDAAAGLALTREAGNAPLAARPEDLPADAAYCLLAVSDSAIAELARALPVQHGLVVHFSGTAALDALLPHPRRAVCWPIGSIQPQGGFPETVPAFCLAPDAASLKAVETLAQALGFRPFEGREAQKPYLHLAAVWVNNFTNHLLALAETLCREQGLPRELLLPLARQTVQFFAEGKSGASQTGPAIRGDRATQQAHLALLATHPEWQALYRALNGSIEKLYNAP